MSHVQHSPAARTWAASISFPGRRPGRRGPPATRGLPGPLPPAGHHDLHGPERRRARLPGQPGARLRGATSARSRHHRPGAIAGPGQRRRSRAGARDPAGHAGQPGPFPSRPCPSWSPPSASAAASSRPRARPPWPSTPSTPSAPRAIGPTTKNAASPSCPAARSSKACARHPARGLGPALRLLLLPRDGVRHGAGHRPGA